MPRGEKVRTKKVADRSLASHAKEIQRRLAKEYPDSECALRHTNALELLVATILSAQCTDARVNEVTKSLFRKYRTAADYVKAPVDVLEEDVRSTGFYRNKAKAIREAMRKIVERHGGRVPQTMDELTALDGVGRKTANVVLGNCFGINDGIVVDTHVRRLSQRMGLSKHDDPEKIEQDLMKLVPQDEWTVIGHRLIEHGRKVCAARKPKCGECFLNDICPSSEF